MRNSRQTYKFVFVLLGAIALGVVIFFIARGHNLQLLNPKGPIAHQERTLLISAISLMLVVAIPMLIMAAFIAWKYRASNTSATYTPDKETNFQTQLVFWGIIGTVIAILAVLNWNSTHVLDPFKPLNSTNKPLTIQVIALQWKWLFIYPEQNIATINYVEFPNGTPVNFLLTADAPMNSFWIPQLGGQMYAMPGMSTQLHLQADAPGEFQGSAAEISGAGFAGMKFQAVATTNAEFNNWVASVKKAPATLDPVTYDKLAAPSVNVPVAYYSSAQYGLYSQVMMKFMIPTIQ